MDAMEAPFMRAFLDRDSIDKAIALRQKPIPSELLGATMAPLRDHDTRERRGPDSDLEWLMAAAGCLSGVAGAIHAPGGDPNPICRALEDASQAPLPDGTSCAGTIAPVCLSAGETALACRHARMGQCSHVSELLWCFFSLEESSSLPELAGLVASMPDAWMGPDGSIHLPDAFRSAGIAQLTVGPVRLGIVNVGVVGAKNEPSVSRTKATAPAARTTVVPVTRGTRHLRNLLSLRNHCNSKTPPLITADALPALVENAQRGGVARLDAWDGTDHSVQLRLAAQHIATALADEAGALRNFTRGPVINAKVIIHDDGLAHWGALVPDDAVGAYVGIRWWLTEDVTLWASGDLADAAWAALPREAHIGYAGKFPHHCDPPGAKSVRLRLGSFVNIAPQDVGDGALETARLLSAIAVDVAKPSHAREFVQPTRRVGALLRASFSRRDVRLEPPKEWSRKSGSCVDAFINKRREARCATPATQTTGASSAQGYAAHSHGASARSSTHLHK